MKKFDKVLIGVMLFPIFPLLLFLLGWWSGFLLLSNEYIPVLSIIGLIFGCVIDVLFLKDWVRKGFLINKFFLILIYLFYSVCVFGFFMGVPIFNIFVGMFAGIYVARSIKYFNEDIVEGMRKINRTSIFTTVVLLFVCIISAYLAINDQYTGDNLKGMLNLSFDVTKEMIIGIIVFGGIGLIISQYWITKITSIFILKQKI